MLKPGPISHSLLENFNTCGYQYYRLRVLKDIKKTQGEAAMWGDRVHKAFDAYFHNAKERPLDPDLEPYRPYLDRILAMPGVLFSEMNLAVDNKWEPTAWNAPNCFLRGIVDVVKVDMDTKRAKVLDHKTGKPKENEQQLKLMALLTFLHWPDVQEVKTAFFWLQFKQRTGDRTYTRDDIPELKKAIATPIIALMEAHKNETWQKKQSGLCRGWCPVTDCEFWSPGKKR